MTSAIVADGDALLRRSRGARSRPGACSQRERGASAAASRRCTAGQRLRAVADVAGDALAAGDRDEGGHEPVVAVAVHGRRERARRRTRTPRVGERRARCSVGDRRGRPIAVVVLRPVGPRSPSVRRRCRAVPSDHQRSIGAGHKRVPQRLDGRADRLEGRAREVAGERDPRASTARWIHTVGCPRRRRAQHVEVVEPAPRCPSAPPAAEPGHRRTRPSGPDPPPTALAR